MLEHLVARGYHPGSGFLSPDGIFYLNIPKNASTFLSNVLASNGWEPHTIGDSQHLIKQAIVVVRDPVERWISGFATYCSSWVLGDGYGSDHFVEDYNQLIERFIFDTLEFDDHTTPQTKFIDQLPVLMQTTFFKLDKTVVNNISLYTHQNLNINNVDANISEEHYDQRQLSKFMRDQLTNRPDLIERINEHYANDFNLIDSVQFYNDAR
jgi:hypothetical protein